MNRFKRDAIVSVLKEFDRRIDRPVTLILIGGSAVIVGHGSARGTKDTETWNSLKESIQKTWLEAADASGVKLQLDSASAVAQAPYNFEDRLQELTDVHFNHLVVQFPDPYDLALMKVCRNADVDREDILHLHSTYNLDAATFLRRMNDELLPSYIGSQDDLIGKYTFVIEILFGSEVAKAQRDILHKRQS